MEIIDLIKNLSKEEKYLQGLANIGCRKSCRAIEVEENESVENFLCIILRSKSDDIVRILIKLLDELNRGRKNLKGESNGIFI